MRLHQLRRIAPVFCALLLGACATTRQPVQMGEAESPLEPFAGNPYPVAVSFETVGARNLAGRSTWNQTVFEDMTSDLIRAQDYLFPVAAMIERAARETLQGPFESVMKGKGTPIRIVARVGRFEVLHSGADSNARCQVSVRFKIHNREGHLIETVEYEGARNGHFDGVRVPEALWASVYEVMSGLRDHVTRSQTIARAVHRDSLLHMAAERSEGTYFSVPPLREPRQGGIGTRYRPGYDRRGAAVIGIDDYRSWPALEGATQDARRMAGVLREQGFEVLEVYNEVATRQRILRLLGEDLPGLASPDTLTVIYFAGHGQTETLPNGEKRGYIIPVDGDSRRIFSTAISMQTLRDLANRIPAKHIYYAMDSCYSGLGFTRGIAISPRTPSFFEKVTSRRVVQMITAGQEGEQAIERGGQGVFTSYLIDALEGGADLNGDGLVTATEIGAFVPQNVTSATQARQTPRFGTLEGAGEVIFEPR